MNMSCTKITTLFLVLAGMYLYGSDKLIISAHPDYPPVMWNNGHTLVGIGPKLAKTIFNELKVPYIIKKIDSWKRVQELAKKGKIDVISCLYINKEREKYLLFSEPFLDDSTSLWARKDNTFQYNNRDDLIGKKGVTLLGDSFGEKFDLFIKQKLTIDRVYDMHSSFKRLLSGKADYVIWGYYPSIMYIRKYGYQDKLIPLKKNMFSEKFYLAFSKKSKFKHLLPKVNEIIRRLLKQGKIKLWTEQYTNVPQQSTHPSLKVNSSK